MSKQAWVIMASVGNSMDELSYPAAIIQGTEDEARKYVSRLIVGVGELEDTILKEINAGAIFPSELEDDEGVYTKEDERIQAIYNKYIPEIRKLDSLWNNFSIEHGDDTFYQLYYSPIPMYEFGV